MFGKKKNADEPVRRDRVTRLIQLGMAETDAADRDLLEPAPSKKFLSAKAAYEAAKEGCTQAELIAAHEALKRHGY